MTRFQYVSISFLTLSMIILCCFPSAVAKTILLIIFFLYLILVSLGITFLHLEFFGHAVCKIKTTQKVVALTFDDGPCQETTSKLLELLRSKSIQVAFFCVGKNVAEQPELTRKILAEGHVIGNHSYTHSYLMNFFGTHRLIKDFSKAESVIANTTGIRPDFFRPPMGLSNPNVFRASKLMGVNVVGWTVRGLDNSVSRSADKIVDRIMKRIVPGAIILLHDGNVQAEKLIETVEKLVDQVHKAGYKFTRLDHLIKVDTSLSPIPETFLRNREMLF